MNNRHMDERTVVIVRWKKPFRSNGRLKGYTVEYCKIPRFARTVQRGGCRRRVVTPTDRSLRITNLDYVSRYRLIVYGSTKAGDGDPNSRDVITLPEHFNVHMLPVQPILEESEVGSNHINITMTPGRRGSNDDRPVGNVMQTQGDAYAVLEKERKYGKSLTVASAGGQRFHEYSGWFVQFFSFYKSFADEFVLPRL
ncbi:unnamed protein product [Toxocara canis]|uniref:Fibronectin type-III domain-containing protein n=1 Tax=Toxocara canis TaxID=6265 RepID=A0A183TYB8_TOXCA|nr:unnamed protein product [Toxocara canis]